MQRFQNTELSDWLRAPRGLKILNGMTWVLPPEILLRTFGTESSGLEDDGGLDVQLDTIMMFSADLSWDKSVAARTQPSLSHKDSQKRRSL